MSQKIINDAKGLFSDPNLLSKVPDGAAVVADNVICDRSGMYESRRGFAQYGSSFGVDDDRAKQLLSYKNRLLVHYDDKLMFNSVDQESGVDGDFSTFSGTYSEVDSGLRIKGLESNRNFYFTTADGVKKIAAKTADDLSTAAGFIVDAGAIKALDVTGTTSGSGFGFLPADSAVAYRVVWGQKDVNDNLLLGVPSSRLVIKNYSDTSTNVDLQFVIPNEVKEDVQFYQVYRTGIFTATSAITLENINPGDEMNLIIEDFPTTAEISANLVTTEDITPDDFRAGGVPLYTNPNSGEGINQANEPPPKAKDITLYQNSIFYANTEVRASDTLDLLSVSDIVDGDTLSIISDLGTETYTFKGATETTNINFSAYGGTIPTDLDGRTFYINAASNARKYYVWFDNTTTEQVLDFTNYNGNLTTDLDGEYCVLYTNSDRIYYIWFDFTGSTADPGLGNALLENYTGIKIDISGTPASKSALCTQIKTDIDAYAQTDFTNTVVSDTLEVETESFDSTGIVGIDSISNGFSYTITTPANADPDPSDRFPIRVNISTGITTTAQLADATAAAILDQDTANDFDITYPSTIAGTTSAIEIVTTQNGNVDDGTQISSSVSGTTVTLGSPTTITEVNHGLVTGDWIEVTSVTTTDLALGEYQVTYIDDNNFTITDVTTVSGTCDYDVLLIGDGFSIVVDSQGDGEDSASNHVLLSSAPSASQQIDETARSIINIVNKNASSAVNAFYLSGSNDIPGQMLFQSRDISTTSFHFNVITDTVGAEFNPTLPTSGDSVKGESETKPNRIYYSKSQQPEAVPSLNFIDVGPEDKEISRVLALRESLFILKEDGVYRLTGFEGNFTVDLFDESTKIISPDSAVVLNNQIFCLANNGIVTISDTGVEVISGRLDNLIQKTSTLGNLVSTTSFGVSYETDRSYLLFVPSSSTDTTATQAFRYRTDTDTWTRFILAKTCGLVTTSDDKLYLGPDDENFIEQERKDFNRTDYADRKFELTLPPESVDGNTLTVNRPNIAKVGDVVTQIQYLTIPKFNQVLLGLDMDSSVDNDYYSMIEAVPGSKMKTNLNSLASKLDADTGPADTDYFASVQPLSNTGVTVSIDNPAEISSTAHGMYTGRIVTISNSTTTPSLDGDHIITKIDDDTFSIDVETTVGGTCDWDANVVTFPEVQGAFNGLIAKLNLDANVLRSNYPTSIGTIELEDTVITAITNTSVITVQYDLPFIEGPIEIYKAIPCQVLYVPETFGDVSVMKQVREGTVMFENNNFTKASVGYKTDLSPGVESTEFDKAGKGNWGIFIWSNQNWGGGFSAIPLRTYIPRQKQRCRYIQAIFNHNSAREQWAVTGISFTFRGISEKAYK